MGRRPNSSIVKEPETINEIEDTSIPLCNLSYSFLDNINRFVPLFLPIDVVLTALPSDTCPLCSSIDNFKDIIFCSHCAECYHKTCLDDHFKKQCSLSNKVHSNIKFLDILNKQGILHPSMNEKSKARYHLMKYCKESEINEDSYSKIPCDAFDQVMGSSLICKNILKNHPLFLGWKCWNCLVCENCYCCEPEEELLVCDSCDQGFHMKCLNNPLTSIPEGTFKCDRCAVCVNCGSRDPTTGKGKFQRSQKVKGDRNWKYDYTLCSDCAYLKDNSQFCPICSKLYLEDDFTLKMIMCDICSKWVHQGCDKRLTDAAFDEFTQSDSLLYSCPRCIESKRIKLENPVNRLSVSSNETLPDEKPAEKTVSYSLNLPKTPLNQNDMLKTAIHPKPPILGSNFPTINHLQHLNFSPVNFSMLKNQNTFRQLPRPIIPIPPLINVQQLLSSPSYTWNKPKMAYQIPPPMDIKKNLNPMIPSNEIVRSSIKPSTLADVLDFLSLSKLKSGQLPLCLICKKGLFENPSRYWVLPIPGFSYAEDGIVRNVLEVIAEYILTNKKDDKNAQAFSYEDKKLLVADDFKTDSVTLWKSSVLENQENLQNETCQTIIRLGALIVLNLGQVVNHPFYYESERLYTKGYTAIRSYWSYQRPFERTLLLLSVDEMKFKIVAFDDKDRPIVKSSIEEAVNCLFEKLSSVYKRFSCVRPGRNPLFKSRQSKIFCEYFFGFNSYSIRRQLEGLPSVAILKGYQFLELTKEEAHQRLFAYKFALNGPPTCARIHEWKKKSKGHHQIGIDESIKKPVDPLLPLLSSSVKYRMLKQNESKQVRVGASSIQGYGLFSTKVFEADEMVIEYVGEVVGQKVADRREKEYDAARLGCYMFRIDDDAIIDATKSGNAARFINHACQPNCYAKIVSIEGVKKVIIFAVRLIESGAELTYDYKFPIEDAKIPCHCGSANCRGIMN